MKKALTSAKAEKDIENSSEFRLAKLLKLWRTINERNDDAKPKLLLKQEQKIVFAEIPVVYYLFKPRRSVQNFIQKKQQVS